MSGDMPKITIGRKHRQLASDAKLGKQRVHSADLHAVSPAAVAQLSRLDMVAPVRNQQRQRSEAIEDARSVPWTGKPLQQFLQHQPRRRELFTGTDSADQLSNFRWLGRRIAPERERPNASVDEKAQSRRRSAL